MPFTLRRRQFLVHPAFGMTTNKAQGQTLKMVDIFLPKPVFTHG
jgi:ATP-dependent DNA helicase PIF1